MEKVNKEEPKMNERIETVEEGVEVGKAGGWCEGQGGNAQYSGDT